MSTSTPTPSTSTWAQRLQPLVRGFHSYATWLVGISWKRFFVLSLLLVILAATTDWYLLLVLAFPIQYLGLLSERWLFFAQARHPQNLYYQTVS